MHFPFFSFPWTISASGSTPARRTLTRPPMAKRTTQFSDELIEIILSFLIVPDMLRCAIVSRRFLKIINSSYTLHLHIEMYMARLVCYPSGNLSPRGALDSFQQTQARWRMPDVRVGVDHVMVPGCVVLGMSGGVLAQTTVERTTEGGFRTIRFTQLPSRAGPIPFSWTFDDVGTFDDIYIDASQDVAIYVRGEESYSRFHVVARSLRTNRIMNDIYIPFILVKEEIYGSYEIGQSVLGMLFTYNSTSVVMMWNFQTGVTVSRLVHYSQAGSTDANPGAHPLMDLTFLNERTFVVAQSAPKEAALHVFSFDPNHSNTAITPVPKHVATFGLPELNERYRFTEVTFEHDCAPSRGMDPPPFDPSEGAPPFRTVPDMGMGLVAVHLYIEQPRRHHPPSKRRYTIGTHAFQFLSRVREADGGTLPNDDSGPTPDFVPWSEWQRRTTRDLCFGEHSSDEDQTAEFPTVCLHGQRFLRYLPSDASDKPGAEHGGIVLMDLNKHVVQRPYARSTPNPLGVHSSVRSHNSGYGGGSGAIFKDKSVFTLPYWQSVQSLDIDQKMDGFYIDDERFCVLMDCVDEAGVTNKVLRVFLI